MSANLTEREHIWDQFLAAWPVERLQNMSLDDYTLANGKDCFTYWLEERTENLGSIWGGSAFKFGIYARKNLTPKSGDSSTIYGVKHAWASKYGKSEVEAFQKVRSAVLTIAQAARNGQASAVESADLGTTVKWKIAFLYQNREKPQWLGVLNTRDLCAALERFPHYKDRMADLQAEARPRFADANILVASDECWQAARQWISTHALSERLIAQLKAEPDRFSEVNSTMKLIGFKLNGNKPFALTREGKTVKIFAPDGEWTKACAGLIKRRYESGEPRSSNLKTCCPEADKGNAAVALKLTEEHDFETFISAMEGDVVLLNQEKSIDSVDDIPYTKQHLSLNQILYGPPGTGKTYATIDEALRILDPALLSDQKSTANQKQAREQLKRRFDELRDAGRIQFVTFHQSFSYEDFVEGIRATTPEANGANEASINYKVEDGVFLDLCNKARSNQEMEAEFGINADAVIWKMSIGEANGSTETRQYCFEHNEARIGWPEVGDLRRSPGVDLAASELQLGRNEQASLYNFSRQIAEGDVVACLGSNTTISAIGVVTGGYEYTNPVPKGVREDYVHRLPVKWLLRNINFEILALNGGKRLTLQTAYPLHRIRWPDLYQALLKAGHKFTAQSRSTSLESLPHVLVIDEINRGNVSRVFGELITLIEPSKRDGQPEALSTILPYSRRRFSVPNNVYILGTMNTADRSLASLDIALRRRFSFKEMPPRPRLLESVLVEGRIPVMDVLETMNQRIEALLDRDHRIGHASFMSLIEDQSLVKLAELFERQILPLLQEYFFEDWERIQWILNDHRKPQELRFVRQRAVKTADLFGANVQAPSRPLWEMNQLAFNEVGAYLGIIDANQTEDDV